MDEMRRDGRLREGQLVCLMALGAGFHWGSLPAASLGSDDDVEI